MMDVREEKKLKRKILVLVPATCLVLGLYLFVPAGTLDYWEAWVYCTVILIPYLAVLATLFKKIRNFLCGDCNSMKKNLRREGLSEPPA